MVSDARYDDDLFEGGHGDVRKGDVPWLEDGAIVLKFTTSNNFILTSGAPYG